MPWGDGTGPTGFGPMTGRGLGYCAGYGRPGYMNNVSFGRGYGRGYGRGFGRRYGYVHPTVPYNYNYGPELTAENELDYLKNDAEALKNELNAIQKRIDELNNKSK